MSEKTKTFLKGISITSIFTIIGGVIGLVYFSVMSRLLTKTDFGYFAALTGIMSIVSAFADAGLGAAIIQKKNASSDFISTAFTMSLGLGLACFLVIFFGAPCIAVAIADDYLTLPLRLMSVTLIFHCFTSVAYAQLYRSLRFKRIGVVGFISNIINTSLSVFLAFKGWGLYAMISYAMVGPILTTLLLYTTSVRIPKIKFCSQYAKGIFSFSGWLTLSVMCNNVAKYIDRILLPKLTSVQTLGAYTRPASFTSNITGQLTDIMDKVLFPMLSDIQDDRVRAKTIFYRAIELLNSFSVVLACLFFFNSDLLIRIFFGKEWLSLVPVMRIVSFTVIFYIDTQLVDCFFRSLNYVKTGFYIRFFSLFWNAICVVIGAHYGLLGIAISLTFANISIIILKVIILNRKLDADLIYTIKGWLRAWKSSIFPILFGVTYMLLFKQPSVLMCVCFALVFVALIFVEFVFFPIIVGKEYTHSIFPYIKSIKYNLITRIKR